MTNHRVYEKQTCLNRSDSSSSNNHETMSHHINLSRNCQHFYITRKYRLLWLVILFLIYSISLIKFNDYFFIQPDFSSKLLSSAYACHDTPSCAAKTGFSINQTITKNKNFSKNAFFSALYTENYLLGALILGYTIRKYHPKHPMYMLYFDDRLQNETTRCALQTIGWTLMNVQRIPPVPEKLITLWPKRHRDTLVQADKRYIDQFTKLILWNMTQFDSIIYLDSDTIVLNDLSHLHELVSEPWRTGFEFAAATDNWFGTYIYKFNAGVLVLHPSELVFKELLRTYSIPGNYRTAMAEQEFLNEFYRLRYLQLPTIYNMNMAIYSTKQYLWETLKPDLKIVHFTIRKPFLSNGKNTQGYQGVYQLYNEVYQDFLHNTNISFIQTTCQIIV